MVKNEIVADTKLSYVKMLCLTVRVITSISYNIYHLKKLKLCLINSDFKVRLLKVTY